MSDDAPRRLASSAEDEALRACLSAGQKELPTAAQLASLAAKLGPLGGGGGPGGGGPRGGGAGGGGTSGGGGAGGGGGAAAAGKATWPLAAKWVGAAIAVTGMTVAVVRGTSSSEPSPFAPPSSGETAAGAPGGRLGPERGDEREPERAEEPGLPSATAAVPARLPTSASAAPPPHGPAVLYHPAEDETALLVTAQNALSSQPRVALKLADDYATAYPNGYMRQEAEVIAINALIKLGRTADAEARARAFRLRYPGSSHIARIDGLLGADR